MRRVLAALAFTLAATQAPSGAPSLPESKSKSVQAVPADAYDALLSPKFDEGQAGAVVVVMKDGAVVYAKGFGLANRELGVPNAPGLVYRIGSMTKQFTAAAVMALVENGKVTLNAPISRYLEGLPEAWRPATVEQLLTHTSGIPSYTSLPSYMAHIREDLPGMKLLEATILKKPLDFAPGAQWRYSNTGYHLLGLIIEEVSGTSYEDYLQTRLFRPLGLGHLRTGTETEFIPGLVSGYSRNGRPAPFFSMTQAFAAGSLVSSAEDLARWTLALHAGKVVSPDSLKRMTRPVRTADGKEHPYGFGLMLTASRGRRLVGHGGRIQGFNGYVEADPEARTVAIVLCNTDSPKIGPDYLTRRLLALAAGAPLRDPTPVPVADSKLQRFVGTYQHDGFKRLISFEKGQLFSQATGGERLPLIPTTELTFGFRDSETTLRFVLAGDQLVGVHRRMDGGAEDALAKKLPDDAP